MRTTPPSLALRQARLHLMEFGDCPPGTIDERLARSWRRSMAAGLLPEGRLAPVDHASGGLLRQTLASNHELLAHSRPVMEYLFDQVRHSNNVVVLADKRGTLMHTLGDGSFLGKAERVALASGASWHEEQRGTNAIGTALAERNSVEIHGAEHFLERNGFLTCAAAPIFSATGELMGILDISGDHRSGHPHTLGLVSTAARMIENRLVSAMCRRNIRLHLHAQPEGIGTVAEGIVALSDDGWVVGANRMGLSLLGLRAGDVGATLLERCVNVRLDDLLSHHKRRPLLPLQLHLADGNTVFVQVHVDAASVAAVGVHARAAPVLDKKDDALSQLDTGDARWRSAAEKARKVMDKPIPLLIQGESGVGKELFARAVHDSGPPRAPARCPWRHFVSGRNWRHAAATANPPAARAARARRHARGRWQSGAGGFCAGLRHPLQAARRGRKRHLPQRPVLPHQRPDADTARATRAHRFWGLDREFAQNAEPRAARRGGTRGIEPPGAIPLAGQCAPVRQHVAHRLRHAGPRGAQHRLAALARRFGARPDGARAPRCAAGRRQFRSRRGPGWFAKSAGDVTRRHPAGAGKQPRQRLAGRPHVGHQPPDAVPQDEWVMDHCGAARRG